MLIQQTGEAKKTLNITSFYTRLGETVFIDKNKIVDCIRLFVVNTNALVTMTETR